MNKKLMHHIQSRRKQLQPAPTRERKPMVSDEEMDRRAIALGGIDPRPPQSERLTKGAGQ